jgi:FAD binding domain
VSTAGDSTPDSLGASTVRGRSPGLRPPPTDGSQLRSHVHASRSRSAWKLLISPATGKPASFRHRSSQGGAPTIATFSPRSARLGHELHPEAVAVCHEHEAPLLSRGGGTSLAGQCCNTAVVIDWSKYCHRLLSVDPERQHDSQDEAGQLRGSVTPSRGPSARWTRCSRSGPPRLPAAAAARCSAWRVQLRRRRRRRGRRGYRAGAEPGPAVLRRLTVGPPGRTAPRGRSSSTRRTVCCGVEQMGAVLLPLPDDLLTVRRRHASALVGAGSRATRRRSS